MRRPESIPNLPSRLSNHAGTPGGIVLGTVDDVSVLTPPPPVVAPPPQPVRVGGAIRQPQRVHHVQPVYPPIAQSARIEGIVIIEATIGEDGQVINARVLRSVPLLDQAALDAVRQWEYMPTQLNGRVRPRDHDGHGDILAVTVTVMVKPTALKPSSDMSASAAEGRYGEISP